jgi:2-methylisocitrate lyase-like PEP mutase family enzyme
LPRWAPAARRSPTRWAGPTGRTRSAATTPSPTARCSPGASGLPVNGDLEDGFGPSPEDCAATVEAAIAGGLAGLGIEDTTADPAAPLHDFDAAVAPKPVNVLIGPFGGFVPMVEFETAGVRRVSLGGALYGNVMGHLARTAARIAAGEPGASVEGRTKLNFNALFG